MNWALLIAGGLTALAAAAHAIGGELTDIRRLLASDVPVNEKIELRSFWHTFSLTLGISALLNFYAVIVPQTNAITDMLRGFGIFYLLCGLIVLLVIIVTQRDHLIKVPQWLLLMVIGGLMLWGS